MFHAEATKTKNLLKIHYSGRVGPGEAQKCSHELPGLLAELEQGFRLLTDMSTLEEMDLACLPYVKAMMDLCNTKGVTLVVRVIPDPHKDIGMNILSPFHYRHDVRIVTCETLDEALQILEK